MDLCRPPHLSEIGKMGFKEVSRSISPRCREGQHLSAFVPARPCHIGRQDTSCGSHLYQRDTKACGTIERSRETETRDTSIGNVHTAPLWDPIVTSGAQGSIEYLPIITVLHTCKSRSLSRLSLSYSRSSEYCGIPLAFMHNH